MPVFYRSETSIADVAIGDRIGDGNITKNEAKKEILVQMKQNPKITAKILSEILGIADRNEKITLNLLSKQD